MRVQDTWFSYLISVISVPFLASHLFRVFSTNSDPLSLRRYIGALPSENKSARVQSAGNHKIDDPPSRAAHLLALAAQNEGESTRFALYVLQFK